MSTKEIERCLKTSIHFPNAIWFSNQDLGTSTVVRGEGMDRFRVSKPGVFDDSPFLDFVADRANFRLGANDEFLKA